MGPQFVFCDSKHSTTLDNGGTSDRLLPSGLCVAGDTFFAILNSEPQRQC